MSRQAIILFNIVLLSILLLPVTMAAAPAGPVSIHANPERMEQHIKALSAFGANADGGVDRTFILSNLINASFQKLRIGSDRVAA